MMLSSLSTQSWKGRVMGTDARLVVVTGDPAAGNRALACAAEDLQATEEALSRFREHSELSRLNRVGGGRSPGSVCSSPYGRRSGRTSGLAGCWTPA